MPALNKHKSPLTPKSNSKAQPSSKPKVSAKMDASEPETTSWTTGPIMDADPKPKTPQTSAAKQFMSNTPKSGGMKQQKQLSKKDKKRKELAAMKAEAFKDQLAQKIEKSTARR